MFETFVIVNQILLFLISIPLFNLLFIYFLGERGIRKLGVDFNIFLILKNK